MPTTPNASDAEVDKLPPSFSLDDKKNFIKQLIIILRDIPHCINKTDGMVDILILTPQGAYDGKVSKAENYINRYKD